MLIKLVTAAISVGVFTVIGSGVQTGPETPARYAWADSCQTCHPAEYESWAKTKHASALERLSSAEQEKECVGCHVTGAKAKVLEGTKVVNKGVQCEACHGAAAAHVADPKAKTGMVVKPQSAKCEECHSDKSPRFKGFIYDAMKGLVHKMK
jgi:Cytochrome c554 and c-prime